MVYLLANVCFELPGLNNDRLEVLEVPAWSEVVEEEVPEEVLKRYLVRYLSS